MYRVKDLAKEFKVDRTTVYRWIKKARIDAVATIGGLRISDEEFEALKNIGREYAPNCNFSPTPKKHPRKRKEGRRPWEK